MKILLLSALRGSIIFYQGEELGLPQVDVPFERLRDPEAITNWPYTLSRDGARTPMPWKADAPNLGFSTVEPWLPVGRNHHALAVDGQQPDSGSILQFTRDCLNFRNAHRALRYGSMHIVEAGEQILAFDRSDGEERLRCTFNLSDRPTPFRHSGSKLISVGHVGDDMIGPYAAIIEAIG